MGCCVSMNNTPPRKHTSKSPPQISETMKEVLSENPSNIPPFLENHTSSLIHMVSKTVPDEMKQPDGDVFNKSSMVSGDEEQPEECSKICGTVCESVSPSTTVTEKKEQNGHRSNNVPEIRQSSSPARVKNESFDEAGCRDKIIGRSPGRISDPSPDRVQPVSISGHESWSSKDRTRRGKRSPAILKHSGSSKNGNFRNQHEKKMSRSPGRAGSVSGVMIRKLDEGEDIGEDQGPTRIDESLENPFVSLECFIFL